MRDLDGLLAPRSEGQQVSVVPVKTTGARQDTYGVGVRCSRRPRHQAHSVNTAQVVSSVYNSRKRCQYQPEWLRDEPDP